MPRISSWGMAQRIILVIGLGLAFAVLGRYLVSLNQQGNFGWFAYAPLNSMPTRAHVGLRPWIRLVIWLGLIGIWTGSSFFLLRRTPKPTLNGPGV